MALDGNDGEPSGKTCETIDDEVVSLVKNLVVGIRTTTTGYRVRRITSDSNKKALIKRLGFPA